MVADLLMDFWEWADGESEDGNLPGVTLQQLAQVIPDSNEAFWLAVAQAGWLGVGCGFLTVPHFLRWLGNSAKKRLRRNQRQARWRAPGAQHVDASVDARASTEASTANLAGDARIMTNRKGRTENNDLRRDVDASVDARPSTEAPTTEPNQIHTPLPPGGGGADGAIQPIPESLDTPAFRAAWAEWLGYRRRRPATLARQLGQLAAWGPARAVAALAHTIASGFARIEEPATRGRGAAAPDPAAEEARRRENQEKLRRLRERDEAAVPLPRQPPRAPKGDSP